MAFAALTSAQLQAMSDALERSTLDSVVERYVAQEKRATIRSEADDWQRRLGSAGLCALLRVLAEERLESSRVADRRIELVWSGPERDSAGSRDTAVVARELFGTAARDVLVSSFALYGGRELFAVLAERMQLIPGLRVRLCLNVTRAAGDGRPIEAIVGEYAARFRASEWPGLRLPRAYYDPRALEPSAASRAVLHAKCIVVDDARALVSSANFTEAAQSRNIEAGVLINDATFARSVRLQFDDLIDRMVLRPLAI